MHSLVQLFHGIIKKTVKFRKNTCIIDKNVRSDIFLFQGFGEAFPVFFYGNVEGVIGEAFTSDTERAFQLEKSFFITGNAYYLTSVFLYESFRQILTDTA